MMPDEYLIPGHRKPPRSPGIATPVVRRPLAPRCPKGHIRLSSDPEGCVVCRVESGERLGWPSPGELPRGTTRDRRERAIVARMMLDYSPSRIAYDTGLPVGRVRELLAELRA